MKFNIFKLQEGGNVSSSTPWVGYTPFFQQSQQEQTSSKKSTTSGKSEEDPTKKQLNQIIGEMVGKGLTNEVEYFAKEVGSLLADSEMLGLPISARQYSAIVSQLNAIRNNKDVYDKAREHALNNGTLSEAAITLDGRLYAQTREGQMTLINPKDYASDPSNYRLLTNIDLLTLRNTSPALIFDNTISETVSHSLSINDIYKSIDEAVKMIQEEDSSSDFYVNKSRAEQFDQGIRALLEEAPDNLIYKVNVKTSTQRKYADIALYRIWSKLPSHAKNTLIAHAAINGYEDPQKGALESISNLLVYGTRHAQHITVKDEGEISSGSSGGSRGSGDAPSLQHTTDVTAFTIYSGGEKHQPYTVKVSEGKDSYEYSTMARISPLVGSKGIPVNDGLLSDIIQESGLRGLLNFNGASYGIVKPGKKDPEVLRKGDFGKIAYLGDEVAMAWLPYTYNSEGRKVVNINVLKNIKKADDEIKSIENKTRGQLSEAEKKDIYKKHNVLKYYTKDGTPTKDQYEHLWHFMIMPTYFAEDLAKRTGVDKVLNRFNNDEENDLIDLFERLSENSKTSKYNPDDDTWIMDPDMYKATLFIPMNEDFLLRDIVGGNSPIISKSRLLLEEMNDNESDFHKGQFVNRNNTLGL